MKPSVEISLAELDEAIDRLTFDTNDPLRQVFLTVSAALSAMTTVTAESRKDFAVAVATDVLSVINRDIDTKLELRNARFWFWVSFASLAGLVAGLALGAWVAINVR